MHDDEWLGFPKKNTVQFVPVIQIPLYAFRTRSWKSLSRLRNGHITSCKPPKTLGMANPRKQPKSSHVAGSRVSIPV